MTSTKTATLLRRYIQENKFRGKPPKIFLHTCCMCPWFPAGNDGNNDLHLRHDGQVHFTQRTRGLPLSACGEILPGIPSQPLNLCLNPVCLNTLSIILSFARFPENGSEQRRSGDYWWIHRNLPKGTLIIIITLISISITSLSVFCAHVTHLSCICSMIWTGWKHYGFHAALWECHLVSAQSCGAAALCFQLRVSGPEVTSIIPKKKAKVGRATHPTHFNTSWCVLSFCH